MPPDALGQIALPFLHALTGRGSAEVAVTKKGHSADNGFRLSLLLAQKQHFVRRRGPFCRNNVDVQGKEQVLGRAEKGGRVMIACGHNQVTAGRGGHLTKKIVVKLLGFSAWRGRVKDVACR